jgi:hypothetical protein
MPANAGQCRPTPANAGQCILSRCACPHARMNLTHCSNYKQSLSVAGRCRLHLASCVPCDALGCCNGHAAAACMNLTHNDNYTQSLKCRRPLPASSDVCRNAIGIAMLACGIAPSALDEIAGPESGRHSIAALAERRESGLAQHSGPGKASHRATSFIAAADSGRTAYTDCVQLLHGSGSCDIHASAPAAGAPCKGPGYPAH